MYKVNTNSVSLAGEFAVLSQLVLRGYDANMTLGNTKGVDILVSDPRTKKMFQIEVKTNLRKIRKKPADLKIHGRIVSNWIMSKKHEKEISPTLFYLFCKYFKSYESFQVLYCAQSHCRKIYKRTTCIMAQRKKEGG